MPEYRFAGRVFPLCKEFTLGGDITATTTEDVGHPTTPLTLTAKITIQKAIVEIVCESNLEGSREYDTRAFFLAFDLARTVTCTYGFGAAVGLSVVLETVINPDGVQHDIVNEIPRLATCVSALATGNDGSIDVVKVLPIIMGDPTIMVAMMDLADSLNHTREAAFRCGRAVDAIRYHLSPTLKRKDGWPVMRTNLNLSHSYLSLITDESTGPRHGDLKNTAWTTSNEILTRTWIIMNRFFEFRLRGDQPLPLDLFPIL